MEIYNAAELFNGPNTRFNAEVTAGLEARGYRVFNPQRDGFDFISLQEALAKILPEKKIEEAVRRIIYSWDIFAINKSDVLIARLDEPQDPGVVHEIDIAKALDIPIIAYRTDVRSPYGSITDIYGGMHTFPIEPAQALFRVQMPSKTLYEAKKDMDFLIGLLDAELVGTEKAPVRKDLSVSQEGIAGIVAIGKMLFSGVANIHSREGLKEIAKRYQENYGQINWFGPRVVNV